MYFKNDGHIAGRQSFKYYTLVVIVAFLSATLQMWSQNYIGINVYIAKL